MALKGIVLTLALTLAAPATALAADASVVTLLRQSQQAAARGQLDQAMDMVNQALSQDPAYPPLWNQKASLQIKAKDYAGAMQTLAVALKVEPENIETNVLALSALLRLDEKAGGKDPASEYMRTIFNFIGCDFDAFASEGVDHEPDRADEIMAETLQKVTEMGRNS